MNLEQLIKLADLLDSRGEHDAASEIDELIRKAAGPFDEPTDPSIERPKWIDQPIGREEPTAVSGPPTMMEDEPTEQDWPIDEEAQAKWDEEETEKMMNEFDTAVNEAKNMLERGVGSHIQLHAGREVKDATEALKKMSTYIKDQLRMQREGDMAYDSSMNGRGDLGVPPTQRQIEELPLEPIPTEPALEPIPIEPALEPIPRGASMQSVFEKLAKVADDLDGSGAQKEADMIDSFLQKYSTKNVYSDVLSNVYAQLRRLDSRGVASILRELDEMFKKYAEPMGEEEEIIKELEKLEGKREVLISKLSNEPVKHKLSKRADDYDEDRKEEGDTEQKKRYDEKHHHSLQIREPKTDKERVDREGRKEHHVENYKQVEAHHLSTRYCPEHIGTQMGRVGQGVFQCPLDGQTYNWEAGWTDFDGNQHPGGSVAAQTPDSTGYAVPHRIFDSREKVLNVVN
jgi:hypothetical protein